MSTAEKMGLSPNEMNLIYDSMNGKIPYLNCLNWKDNDISDLIENNGYYDLATKWEVDFAFFISKLNEMQAIDYLELLNDVKTFWRISDVEYHSIGNITPLEKIAKIAAEMISNKPDANERP
ncbi:hypothetical protein [Flavobacterium sp.]|uniref:hypothetical protein n=1 Tax=Flavobacterium sp. TaxID=239 RepID=UPI0040338D0A